MIAHDSLRLNQNKPIETTHQFEQSVDVANNQQLRLNSTHFNTRFRGGRKLKIQVTGQHGKFNVHGNLGGISGRSANVITANNLTENAITTITSIGRDDPTTAEAQRAAAILRILQGTDKLLDQSPWIQNIWFPQSDEGSLSWPEEWLKEADPKPAGNHVLPPIPLNSSQQAAVNHMHSRLDRDRITLIQGPPGTGKTSVIAAFVHISSIYKGAKTNYMDWKVLVSKDFMYQWHEHLYSKVTNHTIRSDEFNFASNKANLKGIKEIPLRILVVDEASQIEIGDYIPVFSNFKHTLRKSIFEVSHLRKHVKFLDTQYRMPPQIGTVISELVYESKLKSNPEHPVRSDTTACYFLDVPGQERPLESGSFMNKAECEAILLLAQKLEEQEKNYRIITPYDGQRSYIENEMQAKGLDWKDKCFNVDSFQGNEEDFIIISVVRSRSLGFLKNLRRTNVMLSRCKLVNC
ncbi:AAA domain-containing protein [Gymnopilus junonius]|uniref:AAA domain-containing protein n=1 Tax=Gymnopilus junonius TaxID=109634 RepID=A0A9P5NXL9_GYMJU|nr:AAA domain-containing protein [Gymnopilus junonius]